MNCKVGALLVAMKMSTWIILILYVQVYDSLEERTFRCNDGTYISKALYCNRHYDCPDNSDESLFSGASGCWSNLYCEGQIGCFPLDISNYNYKCIDPTARCNTVRDCFDGADEKNCGDVVNVGDCEWHDKKYLCDDKLRCLDLQLTCNGECNCLDCSDEKENCLNGVEKCSQNRCEQKCILFRHEQKCLCHENYSGVAGTNNSKCVSNEPKTNLLLYSTDKEIGVMNLYTNESRVIKNEIEATSVTGAFGHIYFATYNTGKGGIFKIMNGSDKISQIITLNSKVTNLAIDWITNNTYFTTNMSTINVCPEKGDICKQLKNCNALSMGLAPRSGLMFWVMRDNNSTQYIMKSDMDGSNEKLLTVYERIAEPIQINVDQLSEKIYVWTRYGLSFISFNEMNRNVVALDQLPAMFTIFERNFYFVFASYERNKIQVRDIDSKLFRASELMTCHNSTLVTHLYAYNPKLQLTNITNPCVKLCPNSLCLLRSTSYRNILNYTCVNDYFIRPHEENSPTEKSSIIEIIHSTTEAKQQIKGNSSTDITHPKDAPKIISRTEETTPAHTARTTPKKNSGTEGISIVAVLIIIAVIIPIVLCAAAATFFYLNKRPFFQNECPVDTGTHLQPLINNQILADVIECSEFGKSE